MESAVVVYLTMFLSVTSLVTGQEKYNTSDRNIDIDQILTNERLVKSYVDCLLEKRRCTKEGKELKETIPEALESECGKCTDKQKSGIRKVIKYLKEEKPEWWKELVDKYDPKGVYSKDLIT